MRVLVVYEDSHRAYGEALEGAVRGQRTGAEVLLAQARQLAREVERFDPHLVVSSLPNTVDRAAWVTLSEDPDGPSEVCVAGRRMGAYNPGMEELLAVIDETGELVRTGSRLGGC